MLELRRSPFDLPSRVADNLYWLGRHVERAEGIIRHLSSAEVRLTNDLEPSGLPEHWLLVQTFNDEVGADASHAWRSVYCGTAGWIDLDPTNNVIPDTRHITLAWGRDYAGGSDLRYFLDAVSAAGFWPMCFSNARSMNVRTWPSL